jgi:hypothetical protein
MSLLTRKNGSGAAGARGRARQQASRAVPLAKNAGVAVKQRADDAAARAVPLAKNAGVAVKQRADDAASKAVPLAKNAGVAVKQRADDAAAWATPHVNDARAWAAPRVERTGNAVQEKLAPQVSDLLTKAARQLDPEPKPRRRSPLAAGIALLAAAASALAVVALLRRRAKPAGDDGRDETAETDLPGEAGQPSAAAEAAEVTPADVNGQVRTP